jgi:hypothetical protein
MRNEERGKREKGKGRYILYIHTHKVLFNLVSRRNKAGMTPEAAASKPGSRARVQPRHRHHPRMNRTTPDGPAPEHDLDIPASTRDLSSDK